MVNATLANVAATLVGRVLAVNSCLATHAVRNMASAGTVHVSAHRDGMDDTAPSVSILSIPVLFQFFYKLR